METINSFFNKHDRIIGLTKDSLSPEDDYLLSQTNNYELEARIKGFFVNEENCRRFIENHNMEGRVYSEYSKLVGKSFYRYRLMEDRIFSESTRDLYGSLDEKIICKSKLLKSHYKDLWFTLNISSETQIKNLSSSFFEGTIPRLIERYSMVYKNCIIEIGFDKRIWWVEVERDNSLHCSPSSFLNCIVYVIKQLQNSKYLLRWSDYETIRRIEINYKKPVTLNKRNVTDIFSCKWISPKFDGIRKFVIVRMGRMFAVDMKQNIEFLGIIPKKDDELTILDCEEVDGVLYIMDIVNEQKPEERLNKRLEYEEWFYLKPFYEIESLSSCLKMLEDTSVPTDGIIFLGDKILKWKEDNTVDLRVTENGLYASDGKIEGDIFFDDSFDDSSFVYGKVYEMKVVVDKCNRHYICRLREDKPHPNSRHIYDMNTKYTLNLDFFRGYGALLMRKYHNQVKRELLSLPEEKTCLIDIGTGQGGDTKKWENLCYRHIYCIEPDPRACEEFLLRNNKNTIINKYLRDFDLFQDVKKEGIPTPVTVTAFFCMNLFQDKDYNSLFKLLKIEGIKYFICVCLTEIRVMDNSCFTTKNLGYNNYNITIHGTRVINLNETVVNGELLTKRLTSLNYKLLKKESLNKCNYMTIEEKELSSCYKLFVFKKK